MWGKRQNKGIHIIKQKIDWLQTPVPTAGVPAQEGPILAASGLFAFSTLLSWLTLSCHLTACAWMINVSIITDIVVAVGAAVFGTLLLTQFDTVKGCECPVRISA